MQRCLCKGNIQRVCRLLEPIPCSLLQRPDPECIPDEAVKIKGKFSATPAEV